MSDTHETPPTLSPGTLQQVAADEIEQTVDPALRRGSRSRSYAQVVLGASGLLGEVGLLMGSLFGRGGPDDPLVLLAIVAVAPACAGSVWLLDQGMKGLEAAPLPLLSSTRHRPVPGGRRENRKKATQRQLLEVIESNGEITPARAALQTTLTVEEAEQLLSDLARRGHLDVRVEGSRLVYSL